LTPPFKPCPEFLFAFAGQSTNIEDAKFDKQGKEDGKNNQRSDRQTIDVHETPPVLEKALQLVVILEYSYILSSM
jgi:hypothetical protein